LSQTQSLPARDEVRCLPVLPGIDLVITLAALAVFAVIAWTLQYRQLLGEPDLYRVLLGVLDGAESGRWLDSRLHYDRAFGFGYLAAIYALVDPAILTDPDRLAPLINQIGLWALLPGLLCFWVAVRLVHGELAATVALMVFAFSPMMVELGTSGHPVLPMFAFLSAAAVCLFLPLRGWQAVLAGIVGMLLLVAGFLCRGEIFLAFPWLVLSRIDTFSLRRFIVSGLLRSIPPIVAIVVFLALQRMLVPAQMADKVGDYFFEFYTWAMVRPGVVYLVVGCGLATAALGGLALLWLVISRFRPNDRGELATLLGPLALVVVPAVFFLPNPMPTRHFMLTLAGFGIVLGVVAGRWLALGVARGRPAFGRAVVYAVVATLVLANHALAELVRPTLLRANDAQTSYLPNHDAYQTTTHANIGWFWQRHAALITRRERWQEFGDTISTGCDPHTLVFSDEGPHIFTRLYAAGFRIKAEPFRIGLFRGYHGVRQGQDFIVVEKINGWPADAVAAALADPVLSQYRLAQDPWTMSKFDRTPIPADRAASFGCTPGTVPAASATQHGETVGDH
jgi:hypothetical protein